MTKQAAGPDSSAVLVDMEPLMAASRAINAIVVRSLATVDATVTAPQLRVLVMLSTHDRLNLTGVAEGLGVNASNASRTCDQVVKKGLVDRQEDPHDRRQKSLALTAAGRRLLSRVMKSRLEALREVVAALEPQQQHDLMTVLERFNAAAREVVHVNRVEDAPFADRLLE